MVLTGVWGLWIWDTCRKIHYVCIFYVSDFHFKVFFFSFSSKDLSNATLLEHCARCITQNANESFNALLWRMAPKEQYATSHEVAAASALATSIFNQGHCPSVSRIMPLVGVRYLEIAQGHFQDKDDERIRTAVSHSLIDMQRKRVKRRLKRKSKCGFRHAEDYESGAFHSGEISQPKKQRKAPRCRKCNALMKGHGKECPVFSSWNDSRQYFQHHF